MIDVICHCSDSTFGNAALITKWHTLPEPQGRGWDNIGYHYVILNGRLSPFKTHSRFDGHIETGRALDDDNDLEMDEKGAHAFGYNHSVGICLIGLSGNFTNAQMRALRHLTSILRYQFNEINVIQHSDVSKAKPHCAGLTSAQLRILNNK